MRFHKTLEKGQINEWKGYYIPYNELKVHMKHDRVLFVTKVNDSLKLINDFYLRIERIVINEKNKIKKEIDGEGEFNEMNRMQISADDCTKERKSRFDLLNLLKWKDRYSYNQSEKELKRWIQGCERIKRYANLNYQGFRKILKKYDKMYKDNLSIALFSEIQESYIFKSTRIDKTLTELKEIYRIHYAKNDKRKAKNVFENITKKDRSGQMSSFFAGVFLSSSIFALHVIDIKSDKDLNFLLYMNFFFYGLILFGFCMILFKRVYINYKFIFDLEVATCGTISSYFLLISTFMLLTNVGLYLGQKIVYIRPYLFLIGNILVLLSPMDVLSRPSRFFFIKSILKVGVTPLFPIQFRHFIMADCLISFMPCIIGLFPMDIYLIIPLTILPFVIRILQCIRRGYEEEMLRIQILNALKYTISIFFFLITLLHKKIDSSYTFLSWIIFGFFSTLYSFSWDLFIDWECKRRERIFPKSLFFCIIILNAFSRLSWLILIKYKRFSLLIEITRRFAWLLIRTECEHMNNRDSLKAFTGIDIKTSDMFYKNDDETESVVSEDSKVDESIL